MARDPKHGDRSLRADDNYLFMEVLLAAREKLALSYVGRSVQDNAVEPPSTVVTQLREALTRLCAPLASNGQERDLNLLPTMQHPLQPFSATYFEQGNVGLQSFDEEAYVAALSLTEAQKPVDAFFRPTKKTAWIPSHRHSGKKG
jgi:exodeoxyribonuclease V gamma subunit